ncbi:hypothetical protein PSNIH1_14615 [Pantoea sp. PSNIH1]|nr:hypothetical protein PSNIH1_14615 [Pantoea sp. PSNIH1]
MKYFYHRNESGALNVNQFMEVIEEADNNQVYVIDDSAQGAAQFALLRGKTPMTALFSNSHFQLTGDEPDTQIFFSVDDKGKVTTHSEYPEWARTQEELEQLSLVTLYGLDKLSFMEGMKKLSTLPVEAIDSIMGGVLSKLNIKPSDRSDDQSGKTTDKKPRIQNLTADEFKKFYDLMNEAVKSKTLPSMGYFMSHGVNNADLKRGFRTYYKIVVGQNMKPDKFTPNDAYFAEVNKRLESIKEHGVDRSYNIISSKLSEMDADLPISELIYAFDDWDSM